MKRRLFLKLGAGSVFTFCFEPSLITRSLAEVSAPELFRISLAEWSLNRSLRAGKLTNLDFPVVAKRDFGIDCVEFVDQFFADKAKDQSYLGELKKRAAGEGVTIGLIMIDTTSDLGAGDAHARTQAVEKTFAWVEAAKTLGCKTVRINARGPGNGEELRGRIAESCSRLADFAAERGLNIAIENHGGLSSDPDWLVSVFQAVNKPNFGALPDFGNFPPEINRYDAVEKLMPYAKAVSAKSMNFSPEGEILETDYPRMMRIVRDGGYHGFVGVESSPGKQEEEAQAIKWTRDKLLQIREQQRRCKPIFNGKDLSGWTKIEGGEWDVKDGVLHGHHGINWSTNPERTGSWLSTEKQYGDFRLELQFMVNKGGNSGVFFRSAHEKNPAFTGYEMQIHDSPGRPPSKGGPGSLYSVAAPAKNMIRPAGEWNYATIIARGQKVIVEMNGEKIIDTELSRSLKGYIGLQNHDEKSEVRFRNIRLEEL